MKNYISLLIYLLISAAAVGQEPLVNPELAAMIQKTMDHFPRLQQAAIANEMARQKVGIQQANYLPTVTANAGFNYLDPVAEATFGAAKIRFQPHENYNLNLQTNGLIFDFGKNKAAVAKAFADYNAGKATLDALKQTLAYQVSQLYYSIIFTQKSLTVQQEQWRVLQANTALLESKQKLGDALELDVLNARVATANAENRITDLQAQLEKQQAALASLTGESQNAVTVNVFDYQTIDPAIGVDENADTRVALAKTDAAAADIQLLKKFLRPSLTYNAGLGFKNGYQPDINETRFNWGVGAGITYPLYVGGKDRKQLKIGELALQSARAEVAETLRNANLELAQAQADQRAASAKLKSAATVLEQAKAALAIAQTRFANGIATNVDVLNAQSNLEQAALTGIAAQYQLCLAGLQVQKIAGKL